MKHEMFAVEPNVDKHYNGPQALSAQHKAVSVNPASSASYHTFSPSYRAFGSWKLIGVSVPNVSMFLGVKRQTNPYSFSAWKPMALMADTKSVQGISPGCEEVVGL